MRSASHVRRIFTVLIVLAVLGFILQRLLQPKSYGALGHYRADAVPETMSLESIHQGKEVCNECHTKIYEAHRKDIHFLVQCEDCHGPGNLHVKYHRGEHGLISEGEAKMPKNYTLEGCLFCHRKLSARPRTFAQIDPVAHYNFLHVSDSKTKCIACHSPHEPLYLLQEVNSARLHPVISECEDCHDTRPKQSHLDVQNHPVIFGCHDCHQAIVNDFTKHKHSSLRCTTCHLFYRLNETSGRMFKNPNRRFCLLCHETMPFKDNKLPQVPYPDHPEVMAKHISRDLDTLADDPAVCRICHENEGTLPQVAYPDHLARMVGVMRGAPGDLLDNPKMCLMCHSDSIHDSILLNRLREQKR